MTTTTISFRQQLLDSAIDAALGPRALGACNKSPAPSFIRQVVACNLAQLSDASLKVAEAFPKGAYRHTPSGALFLVREYLESSDGACLGLAGQFVGDANFTNVTVAPSELKDLPTEQYNALMPAINSHVFASIEASERNAPPSDLSGISELVASMLEALSKH